MNGPELSRTQINWIVMALRHDIERIKQEMDAAEDASPVYSLGEVAVEGRQRLVDMLSDVANGNFKKITIR